MRAVKNSTGQAALARTRSLFRELGFRGKQLETRARACIAYLTLEGRMFDPAGELEDEPCMKALCEFLLCSPQGNKSVRDK